jgi:hypothetical protein
MPNKWLPGGIIWEIRSVNKIYLVELPANSTYSTILCSKNYELNPRERSKERVPTNQAFPVFNSIFTEEQVYDTEYVSSHHKLKNDSKREYYEGISQLSPIRSKDSELKSASRIDPGQYSPTFSSPAKIKTREFHLAEVSQMVSSKNESAKKPQQTSPSKALYKSSVKIM